MPRFTRLKLAFRLDDEGRFCAVPSGGLRPLTMLAFQSSGVEVSAAGCAPVLLDWEAYGQVGDVMDAAAVRDGWEIAPFTNGRSGPIGLGVQVSGGYADACTPIIEATATIWRRMSSALGSSSTGRVLPVLPAESVLAATYGEFSVLSALCSVLYDEPRLRPRLDDHDRMRRLALDVDARRPKIHDVGTGIGRDAVDIHVILTRLGYSHRYSRPLSDEALPTVAQATDRIVSELESNPHRAGRATDRDQVERIVSRDYVDVDPWPFAALVDD